MIRRTLAAVLLVGLAFGAGFWVERGASRDRVALRIGETEGPAEAVTEGSVAFTVLAHDCGIRAVAGDHADWLPDGQYCRIRLRVVAFQRPVVMYEAAAQEVIDAEGNAYAADLNATQISDQPTSLSVPLRAVQEFDVWFDVPTEAEIVAVRLHAQPDGEGVTVPLAQ